MTVCIGFVCGYKTPAEHCHDTYEELLVCQGAATEKQAARAAKSAATRKHARAKHGAADKPTSPEAA
jgi:hypothetical protein